MDAFTLFAEQDWTAKTTVTATGTASRRTWADAPSPPKDIPAPEEYACGRRGFAQGEDHRGRSACILGRRFRRRRADAIARSSSCPGAAPAGAREPETKPKPKEQAAPLVHPIAHPTLAENVPYFQSSRASAPKTSVVPAAAPLLATTGSHGSPAVLILVFLLGSASLVLVALKDVPTERLGAVPIILSEHRGEVAYVGLAFFLGAAIGLFATFALQ
jgi:hypothetical protein